MTNGTKQKCSVCNKGIIKRGTILFIETDSFYECNHCHTEFHKQHGKFLLKNVPSNSSWNKYEGKLLSLTEIKQIAQGGLSDSEIVQKQAEEEKQEMEKKQEEERRKKEENEEEEWRKQQEQTPGTPQNYLLRVKEILDIEGDNNFELAVQAKNEDEIKQYIKHIGQLQKELKQLKREIAVTKKQIKSEYEEKKSEISSEAAIYGSSRAVTSIRTREKQLLDRQRDLQFKPMI